MRFYYWLLLVFSAFLYALPFLFIDYAWWLVFFFPVPLLFVASIENISFIHGYVWGVVTFLLHLSGGIGVIAAMAQEWWFIGVFLGIMMVLYQAIFSGLFFWSAALVVNFFSIRSVVIRLCIWYVALVFFITWTDHYSLWFFGIKEGYPLMHPLIPLAYHPQLLVLLPIVGKFFLTLLLLLFSVSGVVMIRLRNKATFVTWLCVSIIWLLCWCITVDDACNPAWLGQIKSIAYRAYSAGDYSSVMINIAGNDLKKVIAQYPTTTIIFMPESAFNGGALKPELLSAWSSECIGKSVQVVFGGFCLRNDNYYNTLHWVSDGVLQQCFDKRHAMLISERLAWIMNSAFFKHIYFGNCLQTTISCNKRVPMKLSDTFTCVPYICSELFFNEYPDDDCFGMPVVALVNDTSFLSWYASYIYELLFLVARIKAIQWQREIVYIAYTRSIFIDKRGITTEINT